MDINANTYQIIRRAELIVGRIYQDGFKAAVEAGKVKLQQLLRRQVLALESDTTTG